MRYFLTYGHGVHVANDTMDTQIIANVGLAEDEAQAVGMVLAHFSQVFPQHTFRLNARDITDDARAALAAVDGRLH